MLIARERQHTSACPGPQAATAEDEQGRACLSDALERVLQRRAQVIYELPTPKDLARVIGLRVDSFLAAPQCSRRNAANLVPPAQRCRHFKFSLASHRSIAY